MAPPRTRGAGADRPARGADRRRARDLRRARGGERGQAGRRCPRLRRGPRGRALRVLRGLARQARGRDDPGRRAAPRVQPARARRRRRRGRAVELPAHARRVEDRSGTRRRLHRRTQDCGSQSPLSMQPRGRARASRPGLPPGVLNVKLSGDGAVVGRALGEHPDVDILAVHRLDGGRASAFLRYSADSNLKRGSTLELGGKSPNIILSGDAPDLDAGCRHREGRGRSSSTAARRASQAARAARRAAASRSPRPRSRGVPRGPAGGAVPTPRPNMAPPTGLQLARLRGYVEAAQLQPAPASRPAAMLRWYSSS